MTAFIVATFAIVYFGMIIGSLPGLKVNRASIALIGAVALVASGALNEAEAMKSIDFATIGLLFGLMIVSANFDLSGVYSAISDRAQALAIGPQALLAVVVALCGAMSALLTNDVVAVALAPVLLGYCIERKHNPVPFLLALALSCNAGSIATIMGSPQNMLLAEHFKTSFLAFSAVTFLPAITAMAIVWAVIAWLYRDDWQLDVTTAVKKPKHRDFNRLEAIKGVIVVVAVVVIFVATDWRRDLVALSAGAILLANASFSSHKMLHRVDWELLIMIIGLFVVNAAFQSTGLPQDWIKALQAHGIDLSQPATIFIGTMVLSDIVSNVPSVMLLLPFVQDPKLGPIMAVASGLSSNLIVVGSLASIIVVDAASQRGLTISFWTFARTGIPVTLVSVLVAAAWLWLVI